MPVPAEEANANAGNQANGTTHHKSFDTPKVYDHPNGWGPSTLPPGLSEIPYAPYSKSDRLGRVADWTSPADDYYYYDREGGGANAATGAGTTTGGGGGQRTYNRRDNRQDGGAGAVTNDRYVNRRTNRPQGIESFGAGTASAFEYKVTAEEEGNFSLVDRGPAVKPKTGFRPTRLRGGPGGIGGTGPQGRFGLGRGGPNAGGNSPGGQQSATGRYGGGGGGRGGMSGGAWRGRRFGYQDKPQRVRDASVKIGAEWKMLQEIDFNGLSKLFFDVDDPEDM